VEISNPLQCDSSQLTIMSEVNEKRLRVWAEDEETMQYNFHLSLFVTPIDFKKNEEIKKLIDISIALSTAVKTNDLELFEQTLLNGNWFEFFFQREGEMISLLRLILRFRRVQIFECFLQHIKKVIVPHFVQMPVELKDNYVARFDIHDNFQIVGQDVANFVHSFYLVNSFPWRDYIGLRVDNKFECNDYPMVFFAGFLLKAWIPGISTVFILKNSDVILSSPFSIELLHHLMKLCEEYRFLNPFVLHSIYVAVAISSPQHLYGVHYLLKEGFLTNKWYLSLSERCWITRFEEWDEKTSINDVKIRTIPNRCKELFLHGTMNASKPGKRIKNIILYFSLKDAPFPFSFLVPPLLPHYSLLRPLFSQEKLRQSTALKHIQTRFSTQKKPSTILAYLSSIRAMGAYYDSLDWLLMKGPYLDLVIFDLIRNKIWDRKCFDGLCKCISRNCIRFWVQKDKICEVHAKLHYELKLRFYQHQIAFEREIETASELCS
jgi:hypothetical protein